MYECLVKSHPTCEFFFKIKIWGFRVLHVTSQTCVKLIMITPYFLRALIKNEIKKNSLNSIFIFPHDLPDAICQLKHATWLSSFRGKKLKCFLLWVFNMLPLNVFFTLTLPYFCNLDKEEYLRVFPYSFPFSSLRFSSRNFHLP